MYNSKLLSDQLIEQMMLEQYTLHREALDGDDPRSTCVNFVGILRRASIGCSVTQLHQFLSTHVDTYNVSYPATAVYYREHMAQVDTHSFTLSPKVVSQLSQVLQIAATEHTVFSEQDKAALEDALQESARQQDALMAKVAALTQQIVDERAAHAQALHVATQSSEEATAALAEEQQRTQTALDEVETLKCHARTHKEVVDTLRQQAKENQQALKQENAVLIEVRNALKKDNTALRKQCSEQSSALEKTQRTVTQLQQRIELLTEQHEGLKAQHKALSKTHTQVKRKCSDYLRSNTSIKDTNKKALAENTVLRKEKARQEVAIEGLTQQLQAREAEHEAALTQATATLQTALSDKSAALDEVRRSLHKNTRNLDRVKRNNTKYLAQIAQMKKDMAALSDTNETLRAREQALETQLYQQTQTKVPASTSVSTSATQSATKRENNSAEKLASQDSKATKVSASADSSFSLEQSLLDGIEPVNMEGLSEQEIVDVNNATAKVTRKLLRALDNDAAKDGD